MYSSAILRYLSYLIISSGQMLTDTQYSFCLGIWCPFYRIMFCTDWPTNWNGFQPYWISTRAILFTKLSPVLISESNEVIFIFWVIFEFLVSLFLISDAWMFLVSMSSLHIRCFVCYFFKTSYSAVLSVILTYFQWIGAPPFLFIHDQL